MGLKPLKEYKQNDYIWEEIPLTRIEAKRKEPEIPVKYKYWVSSDCHFGGYPMRNREDAVETMHYYKSIGKRFYTRVRIIKGPS